MERLPEWRRLILARRRRRSRGWRECPPQAKEKFDERAAVQLLNMAASSEVGAPQAKILRREVGLAAGERKNRDIAGGSEIGAPQAKKVLQFDVRDGVSALRGTAASEP